MSGWTLLDSVLVGIVVFAVVFSGVKGFARELVSLLSLGCGFLLACWLYPAVARGLLPKARTPDVTGLAAFLSILVAALIAGGFLSHWAGKAVDKARLRWFDRLLGASLGLIRGLLFCMIAVVAMATFSVGTRALARSRLAPYLFQGARRMVTVAPAEMRGRFVSGMERVQKLWGQQPVR